MEFPTIDKFTKEVAEKALDEITYEGKTIREWVEIITKQQQSEDAISRSELLRHQHIIYDDDGEDYKAVYVKDIKAMPSVTPERPKGKWIFKDDNIAIPTGYYQCSECEEGKLLVKDNFCPNCGAEMSGGE